MITTKATSKDKDFSEEKTKKTTVITLSSNEIAWLFGIKDTVVKRWIKQGVLTPCSNTPEGIDRFRREDVAELAIDIFQNA